MTDLEFDVLDELYFVVSFNDLQEELEIDEPTLKEVLHSLLQKKWIKCYLNASEEALQDEIDYDNQYKSYHYLATKQGLLAHNGRS